MLFKLAFSLLKFLSPLRKQTPKKKQKKKKTDYLQYLPDAVGSKMMATLYFNALY